MVFINVFVHRKPLLQYTGKIVNLTCHWGKSNSSKRVQILTVSISVLPSAIVMKTIVFFLILWHLYVNIIYICLEFFFPLMAASRKLYPRKSSRVFFSIGTC